MSPATTPNSGIFSLSYSFALKFALKAKLLNDLEEDSNTHIIRSVVYEFKTAKDLRFYLEIGMAVHDLMRYCSMNVKGSSNWSFKLDHAILVTKDRVFCLNYVHKLRYLPLFDTYSVPDEEDITIQCVVTASSVHPELSTKEEDLNLMEVGKMVEFEGIPGTTLPSDYTNEMVIDFIQRGVIPDFYDSDKRGAVSKAVEILVDMEKHKCEALKNICMQYLEDNIDADVLCQISRAALRSGLRDLEIMCMEFAASGVV